MWSAGIVKRTTSRVAQASRMNKLWRRRRRKYRPALMAITSDTIAPIFLMALYGSVLVVAIRAKNKSRRGRTADTAGSATDDDSHEGTAQFMIADRDVGLYTCTCSMTATWVGGSFLNTTTEAAFKYGLVGCQAPLCYACSLLVGGRLFASKMRSAGYRTMLDPFQEHFSSFVGALLFLPALLAEVLWVAVVCSVLASAADVLLRVAGSNATMGPAFLLMFTTFVGGLTAVVHADTVQLIVMFLGMWFCVPFVYFNQHVVEATYSTGVWLGSFTTTELSISYLDNLFALILGGVPWQVYFQRVLACRTPLEAEQASYVTALGCILAAVPAIIIGSVAKAEESAVGNETQTLLFQNKSVSMLLPLTLRHMSPPAVSAVGLTAVSAAAMSSVGSSTLSVASMFAWNVYKAIFRTTASDYEVDFVMRLSVVVAGITAVYLTSADVNVLRALWSLSADLVYIVLFPHLLSVFYLRDHCNTYGALTGYVVGVALRANSFDNSWTSGPLSDNRQVLHLEKSEGQHYPVRTMAMMTCLATVIGTSLFFKWLFTHLRIPSKYDVFECFSASSSATVRHQPRGYFNQATSGASFLPSRVPRLLLEGERKPRVGPEARPLFEAGHYHASDCVQPARIGTMSLACEGDGFRERRSYSAPELTVPSPLQWPVETRSK